MDYQYLKEDTKYNPTISKFRCFTSEGLECYIYLGFYIYF